MGYLRDCTALFSISSSDEVAGELLDLQRQPAISSDGRWLVCTRQRTVSVLDLRSQARVYKLTAPCARGVSDWANPYPRVSHTAVVGRTWTTELALLVSPEIAASEPPTADEVAIVRF